MEAFDTTTGCFDRIWESKEYPKPAHWNLSPDGEWVWIVVSIRRDDDDRLNQDLTCWQVRTGQDTSNRSQASS